MKCEGCGKELADTDRTCPGCGRAVGLGQHAAGETLHVAKETGALAGKVGKGLWGGVKSVGGAAKKGLKGEDEEKKS